MQITFLGTGTGLPNWERAPSGLLVQLGQHKLLFDSGSGTIGRSQYEIIRHPAETFPYSHASSPETGPG
jgi:ribonuclease BN (tRNA processing enzyme)